MIYFDNASTTMQKPPEVSQAIVEAIKNFGNPGRSFHKPSMEAARTILNTRKEIAQLVKLENPLNVAFTSGATESLNLVLDSLVTPEDHVITSVLEHNSVLRPLYKTGCELSFIPADSHGRLNTDHLDSLIKGNTRFLICTHGSNLTGAVTDIEAMRSFCREKGLIFILDVSQTLGSVETLAEMADILCFTGHKMLFGPQGTGGIIVNRQPGFKLVKTGGSGSRSFDAQQSLEMPEIFEAGTPNTHGLAGLCQGTAFINRTGIAALEARKDRLLQEFLSAVSEIPVIRLYSAGTSCPGPQLPIIALNIGAMPADELALQLWEKWQIATRAGSHCAPLAHKHFKTEAQGMVRFSFSTFNTSEEIALAVQALNEIALKA